MEQTNENLSIVNLIRTGQKHVSDNVSAGTYFTIRHLSEFSGIKPHTIRMWEQRFPFLRPYRTDASRRYYTPEQVRVFLQVTLLKQNGHRLSHIGRMDPTDRKAVIAAIGGIHKYADPVNELISCMAAMDMNGFEHTLSTCIEKWGIHNTVKFVITTFAEKTGIFDQNEKISYRQNIALVQESLKQKLYVAIESAGVEAIRKQARVLMFIPATTAYELPLLYTHYLLKREGYITIYLGRNITVQDLTVVSRFKKPDFILTQFASTIRQNDMLEYINCLPVNLPASLFISIGCPLDLPEKNRQYVHVDSTHDAVSLLNKTVGVK